MNRTSVARLGSLPDREPAHALVGEVDLVVVRFDDEVSVFYGRCLHRGALMSDGFVRGKDLICGVHNWDYRLDTGVSAYANDEKLPKFTSWIEGDEVLVDADEIAAWALDNPQPYNRDAYLGLYADVSHGTAEEPHNGLIQSYARDGLKKTGHHGKVDAMGVPRGELPTWDDIQILTAQLHRAPLLDDERVGTDVVIGPNARKPLRLKIPLFVSDMSFGALSEPAKVALARGRNWRAPGSVPARAACCRRSRRPTAGTSTSWPPRGSASPGTSWRTFRRFISKAVRAPRPEPAGTCPARRYRAGSPRSGGLNPGRTRFRLRAFPTGPNPRRSKRSRTRCATGPAAFRSATSCRRSTLRRTSTPRLEVGVDYIILDGRGGGTGAAPIIFRDNISVPTIPALARARRHLDHLDRRDVTLVITGGLRKPADFIKAMALGADAVAVSNAAMQAIGCIAMRACHTNNCPVGIASQKPHLVSRIVVEKSARQLANFFEASVELMQVMARACGHNHLSGFNPDDLTTWKKDMSDLSGVAFGGVA